MTVDLKVLAAHRDALLLAEAIGWLHDYRKCSEEHLQTQAPGSKTQALPRTELSNRQSGLQNISLALPTVQSSSRTVTDLLNDRTWNQDTLGQFLSRCHNTAHFDKQEPVGGEQNYPGTQISSPFGFEKSVGTTLTARLWGLTWSALATLASDRQDLREKISILFAQAVADSRRPINEVDLWSWGSLVGALYKSALAGSLLTGIVPSAQDLRWRLLSIRVNGLEYVSDVARVPDLLARQKLLSDALDQVRTLLEVEYPLGSEVYRDQDGSIFIVPDVSNLLRISDNQGTTLEAQIIQTFTRNIEGDLLPLATLEQASWWGQDPNWSRNATTTNDKLPDVKGMLTKPVTTQADVQSIEALWQGQSGKWELCPVCRLRPKHEDDEVCQTCEDRRIKRIQDWLEHLDQTIWLDEVADTNGRLALIVGDFGLDDWLSGKLVQTMLVKADPTTNTFTPKNPSPARLRRIWETTQRFWETVFEEERVKNHVPPVPSRLIIVPKNARNSLKPHHTYDLIVNERRLSAVWDGKRLITCDNLDYFKKLTDQDLHQALTSGSSFDLYTPAGYGQRSQKITSIVVGRLELLEKPYFPTLILLAEPRTFMALVPADKALEVVQAIKEKYEREMSKVRNRLPLTLGVVYFGRRTPLAAALDAGRRMIHQPVRTVRAEVNELDPAVVTTWPVARKVTLRIGERKIALTVPTVMGDGETPDNWYPYWQVKGPPTDRTTRWFKGPDGKYWVHVCELQEGDRVAFTPSTFDYEYLDTTTRRFEVIYRDDGQRRSPEKRQRPYLLEELDELEQAWEKISRLSKSQIYAVISAIETKREAWSKPLGDKALTLSPNDAFRQFVRDTLKEAAVYSDSMERAALSGMLRDALEIHLEIMTSL